MSNPYRYRRIALASVSLLALVIWLINSPASFELDYSTPVNHQPSAQQNSDPSTENSTPNSGANPENHSSTTPLATEVLKHLTIKGRAPKTGYTRSAFYDRWPTIEGCSLRQRIIKRELGATAILNPDNHCTVISGEFTEPYTGAHLIFTSPSEFAKKIQIDHVVALSDAWQKGAQYLSPNIRFQIATDPLNLLAVDSSANQQKGDGDAATWLPPNKAFRCQYVARQVSVKYKYTLSVTQAEHDAIARILATCPTEPAIGVSLASASTP